MEPSVVPITKYELYTPTADAKRRRSSWVIISPEVGSLYDILHDHAGVSLYVLPICWTDLHAQLLGCRFVQLPSYTNPVPPSLSPPPSSASSSSPRRPFRIPPTVISIGRALDVLMAADRPLLSKNRAISSVISTFYPEHLLKPHNYADLDLRFGCRHYPRAVRCQLLWNHADINNNPPSFASGTTLTISQSASLSANHSLASITVKAPDDSPMLAYISRSHLDHVRRNGFRILNGPKGTFNHPVRRLQALRSKNLLPKKPDEDSYFLATMIAMAQQAVYADIESGAGFTPRDVKVRVLTVAEDENAFVVYTAVIPSAFLSRFHRPNVAAVDDATIKVEYAHVPVWPILGLKERLGMALGADLVGRFDGVPIDTYDTELSQMPESSSPKRRRDVFSEVLNASFSEDCESDRSGDIFRKRRCMEESRVGVVR